ncbi:hypothetical protein LTR78_002355 [Recurvomyces mirabilis]|uniref:FAD-binding FR-type domain-containing protein n=1 Tax=Recurvomyces mirabilis TaxID=574656 RepID=A0AAE1C453_9PEZI|nr:hypothetical protein LTR78_002355 [Recurvomyces mirabilis]KAK5157284.1 hypothetical protein LTS14_004049 [Recurvomyces mirabilis]
MVTSTPEIPIPQPSPHWLLGNIPDIDSSQAMLSTMKLAKLYGPIVRTDINGVRYIRIGSQALAHEICDDERFEKNVETNLRFRSQKQYDEHIHFCWKLCDEIVADRKAHPKDVNDLLNVTLQSSDPDTGEKTRDELIRFEMMTFLLAGHDTTSGLLNFAFLLMLKNPRTLERTQKEVDGVLGDGAVEVRHYAKLPYIEAVLREKLRLYPTAPSITRMSKGKEDTFIGGGKYRIHAEDALVIYRLCSGIRRYGGRMRRSSGRRECWGRRGSMRSRRIRGSRLGVLSGCVLEGVWLGMISNASTYILVAGVCADEGDGTLLQGVRYAVLGVGNSDWVSTFHRQPKLIDSLMEAMGAIKIIPTVLGDVSRDICGAYDEFTDTLWKALDSDADAAAAAAGLKLELTLDRLELLGEKEMSLGTVKQHLQLADTSVGPEKRLMEVELPGEASYVCGDYLVVLPTNHSEDVKRVLLRFGLPTDAMVKMSNTHKTFQPSDRAEYAFSLVAAYLEIGTPISRKQLSILAAATTDTSQQEEIQSFAAEDVYEESILAKRASIIDILEKYPACKITFAEYVDMLQPMLPRQYSIASSPLASPPGHATILYDVLSSPSHFDSKRPFHGTGSTYLSSIPVSGKVHCYVRSTNANFRLPLTQSTPMIMVCAGTGFAPMRGFVEERAAIIEAQKITPGKALLYFECRDREKDFLCRSELEAWEEQGIVELRPTFSKAGSAGIGYKYVPDRLWAEREEIVELFRAGAKVFLCGSASKLARSTNEVFEKIVREAKGCGLHEAKAFLDTIKQDRYVTDIFG